MRLIDANELYRVKFHGYPDIEITPSDVNAEAYKRGWNDAIDAVVECAPAVEVVRCKDCKFFKGDGLECHHSGMFAYEDDYCSNGERREDV
jgi:hypothetical protein